MQESVKNSCIKWPIRDTQSYTQPSDKRFERSSDQYQSAIAFKNIKCNTGTKIHIIQ